MAKGACPGDSKGRGGECGIVEGIQNNFSVFFFFVFFFDKNKTKKLQSLNKLIFQDR